MKQVRGSLSKLEADVTQHSSVLVNVTSQIAATPAPLTQPTPATPVVSSVGEGEKPFEGKTLQSLEAIIQSALTTFAADRTNLRDFALLAGRGKVVGHSPSFSPQTGIASPITGFLFPHLALRGVEQLITESPGGLAVGGCWAMQGQVGFVVLQLSEAVKPTHFSVEHISRQIAPDPTTAPNSLKISLFSPPKGADVTKINGFPAGTYNYDLNGSPLQLFSLVRRNFLLCVCFVRFTVLHALQ